MSLYPSIAAGTRITGSLLQAMIPNEIVKPASTDRASTTTLADDPDLLFTAVANAVYKVRFYCWFSAIDAAKVKTAWTVPSGTTGNRSTQGPGSTANQASMDNISMRHGVHAFTTSATYGTRNSASNHFLVIEESIVSVGSTAGTVALQWAQATSDVTAAQLRAESTLTYRRIG